MEVVETEPPEGECEPVYVVENGRIVQSWQAVEPEPEPQSVEDRLDMIEECLLELSEVIYA
jgi:hypothetical protein